MMESFANVVGIISALCLALGIPICLVMLIFKATRQYAATGFYFIVWPLAFWIWLCALLHALSVSIAWAVIGILLAGIGVVPVALIMMLIRGDWYNLGSLAMLLVILSVLRWFSLWLISKTAPEEPEY